MKQDVNYLKSRFARNAKPTEQDFGDLIDTLSDLSEPPSVPMVMVKTLSEWFGEVNPVPKGVVAVAKGTNYVVTGDGAGRFCELLDMPFVYKFDSELYSHIPIQKIVIDISQVSGNSYIRAYEVYYSDGSTEYIQSHDGSGLYCFYIFGMGYGISQHAHRHRKIQVVALGWDTTTAEDNECKNFSIDEDHYELHDGFEIQTKITGAQLEKRCRLDVSGSSDCSVVTIESAPSQDYTSSKVEFSFYTY